MATKDVPLCCALCGKTIHDDSTDWVECDFCQHFYCQSCCWQTIPMQYKLNNRPVIKDETDAEMISCDWCKWDLSWDDKFE